MERLHTLSGMSMSRTLRIGENAEISAASARIVIAHDIGDNQDVNLTAFLLGASGKVRDDDDMVFFNSSTHSSGAATYLPPSRNGNRLEHQLLIDLGRLPNGCERIAVTLSEDSGRVSFADIGNLSATIDCAGSLFTLLPGSFSSERGIIVLEMYVRNGSYKLRSVLQGFASGLAGLCGNFGVEVDDDGGTSSPASASPPPPLPPLPSANAGPVRLEKPGQSHRISLSKHADAPAKIIAKATWIDNGDGMDNDDLDLRVGILYPDGRMGIIQAPDKSGSFDAAPYVRHNGDVTSASKNAPGCETVEVNPAISRNLGGNVALVFSVYSAISNGAVSVASLRPTMRIEYGEQIIECSYPFKSGFRSSAIYTYVIGIVEIDQDAIDIRPAGVTSKFMSEATPWLQRNGKELVLSMDGPPVFKGHPVSPSGGKRYT